MNIRPSKVGKTTTSNNHFIVAIGASAGGLEAIHEFFDHMPETANLSFVIIQHLSPDYKSLLVDLVSRHTHMKVFEAEHKLTIQKNCIYVIPNNKIMTIGGSKLLLAEKAHIKAPNTAIDTFLYTLAEEKKDKAIAIILSGTGTDGTRGIESIKAMGGMVLVQDPSTAKFDGMPNSAITSGNADMVLPPEAMPAEMYAYIQGTPGHILDKEQVNDAQLEEIFTLIHKERGHDFHYYKTPTIIRRISRRMAQHNFQKLDDYVGFMREHPEEAGQLGKDFLIGVTRFFRDAPAYELLEKEIIPAIALAKRTGDIIKIWIAACSTGEEAYSVAILFDRYLQAKQLNVEIKVFATDMDESHIDIASRGKYPLSVEKDISPEILSQYFTKDQGCYTIIPRVRRQIVFAKHNIIKDPPFIKNDFASCRNMLIYMDAVLQQKVLSVLVFSLLPDAYLLLGPSESVASIKDMVTELNSKWKLYRKTTDARHNTNLLYQTLHQGPLLDGHKPKPGVKAQQKNKSGLAEDFQAAIADELGYAAFYIDSQYEIKDTAGNFEYLLSLPKKSLRLNLLKMLPQELSVALSIATKDAWRKEEKVVLRNVRYRQKNKLFAVTVIIKPPVNDKPYTLIVLGESFVEAVLPEQEIQPLPVGEFQHGEYVADLEAELQETRHSLQMAVEGLETANEELQSSNEELLSANEELQSSNEELQSLNEELHTLNTEHQLKIKELIELNDDLNNYFRSSDIGQVFLDETLRIRKFNPASVRMINFIETDIGRPINHISTNIRYDNLVQDAHAVMATGHTLEKEVQLHNGKNLLIRIMPYLKQDKQKGGVIIAFVDITVITDLNNIIRGIFNSSRSAIIAFKGVRDLNHKLVDFSFQTANQAANRFLGKEQDEYIGKSLKKDGGILVLNGLFEKYVKVVQEDQLLHEDVYIPDEDTWYEVTAVKMIDGLVATYVDITAKKHAEQKLRKNYNELISVKENLKNLNTELEDKVTERTHALSESEERFRLVSQATNDAIWDWDFVNNKVWWNESFFTMFGYPRAVYDRSFWLSNIHPDEQALISKSIYAAINSSENQWSAEYRFKKADGSYAHILDRAYVLHDEFHTPYRMLGSMLDVTDLKIAEEELASNIARRKFLAESMPLVIWTANAAKEVEFVNHQFETYTGIPATQALQGAWKETLHNDDLAALNREWDAAGVSGSDFYLEVRIRLANGEYHWNLLRAKARKDAQNRLEDWVITNTDIHEQKVINEVLEQKVAQRTAELKKTNIELENSNNDLQQFASVASHDLQEPLRKIHMFSKLIKDKYSKQLEEGASDYLDRVLNASVRMRSLITDILNFSKLSANTHHFEPTNLNIIIHAILDDLEIAILEKKAQVHVASLPVLEVIPGQIRQVFQNLVSNSLKFMKPEMQPVITIEAHRVREKSFNSIIDESGPFCLITVKDNGIGFDEQFKNSIFTLFQRLHSKDKFEGSGIGLAITKKIIDKHNGLITADSKNGEGATFTILLPVQQEEETTMS
jgi:two-component system CheB/CheR fusion protein